MPGTWQCMGRPAIMLTWWFSEIRRMTLFSSTYRELSIGLMARSVGHSRRTWTQRRTIIEDVEPLWSVSVNSALQKEILLLLLLISPFCSFYPCFWSHGMHFPIFDSRFPTGIKKKKNVIQTLLSGTNQRAYEFITVIDKWWQRLDW